MSRTKQLEIYENAVPLSEAWIKFSSAEHADAYRRLEHPLEIFSRHGVAESLPALGKAVQAGFDAARQRSDLISDMQEKLLEDLFNSELVALGIRQRPSKSHYPVTIEASFFDYADPNWEQSTLQWEGRLYSGVRVYDGRIALSGTGNMRPRGSISAIDAAISDLIRSNDNFCRLVRKEACQLVRDRLGDSGAKGNGLSDKNLSKRILLQCPKRAISR